MGAYDYSQNDPRWRDVPLGFSLYYYIGAHNGNHDCAGGCLVSALACAVSNLGHPFDPAQMNAELKARSLIDRNGDVTRNDVLALMWSDIVFVERKDWPTQPAPLDYFDVRNDLSTEIIVLIDTSPAPDIQQHWLRVVGWDGGSDIIVVDPWDGVRKGLSAYAKRESKELSRIIYAAIKFRRASAPAPAPVTNPVNPGADVQPAPVAQAAPAPVPPQAPPESATIPPSGSSIAGGTPGAAPAAPQVPGTATDVVLTRPPGSVVAPGSDAAAPEPAEEGQPVLEVGFLLRLFNILLSIARAWGKKKP